MPLADRWPLSSHGDVRDALLAAYASPERSYHDTRHLSEVLDRLDELPPDFDRRAVVLAAWFHDAIYDGRADDEERSARWALDVLTAVDPSLAAEVARLVRMTAQHRPADDDAEACALSDADLAILAAAPERYAEYVAAVRREYAHVPDDAFAAARSAILRDLLAKDHLFHSAYARDRWETPARRNLTREVAAMARRSGRSG